MREQQGETGRATLHIPPSAERGSARGDDVGSSTKLGPESLYKKPSTNGHGDAFGLNEPVYENQADDSMFINGDDFEALYENQNDIALSAAAGLGHLSILGGDDDDDGENSRRRLLK